MDLVNFIRAKSVRTQLFFVLLAYVVTFVIRAPFLILGYDNVANGMMCVMIAASMLFVVAFIRFWIDSMNDSKAAEEQAIKTTKYLNEQGIDHKIGFDFKKSRVKMRVVY
ncbi:hypothetical protein [Priestia megaterium]|uniref:hypothetical protein n=1 Tax=Priestia megaterium TaxID=1404 RepID=UPI00279B5036|nr:hypothetical protein [Priestia megaterium]WDC90825.1 hypothetical protein PSR56_12535 [Priestia megaterium]